MHSTSSMAMLVITLLALLQPVASHSWIEEMQVISDNGSYVGDYGYTRGYMARTEGGFNGDSVDYLLPPLTSGRTRINASDLLCHPSQRTANYSSSYPKLQVKPGDYVAMKYLENGHVTLPQNQLGKPKAGGTVFVYSTTKPSDTETIADVLRWSAQGDGGDKRGTLLTSQNFDDARCHQLNSGTISQQRQQQFPDRVPDQPTSNVEQWCETDVKIPASSKTGSTVTLYWVWQWPTEPGADPTYPTGKDEYYTSCMDIDVVADLTESSPVHTLQQQDPQSTAVKDFKSRTAYTTSPAVTLAGASASSAAPYGFASASTMSASSPDGAAPSSAPAAASYSARMAAQPSTFSTVTRSVAPGSSAAPQPSSSPSSSAAQPLLPSQTVPYITFSLSYLPSASTGFSSASASAVPNLGNSSSNSSSSSIFNTASTPSTTPTASTPAPTVTVTETAYITATPSIAAADTAAAPVALDTTTQLLTSFVTVTATATANANADAGMMSARADGVGAGADAAPSGAGSASSSPVNGAGGAATAAAAA